MSAQPNPSPGTLRRDRQVTSLLGHHTKQNSQIRPNSPFVDVRDLPWWTAADQAELEVLGRALFLGIEWHLKRCPIAAENKDEGLGHWCRHLSAAVEEVIEWRDARETYSRAVWLRQIMDSRDRT